MRSVKDGYSGLPKWLWPVVPLFLYEVYHTISVGVWDMDRAANTMNVGSAVGGMGITGVFAAFIIHDWWLMLRDRWLMRTMASRLNRKAMMEDPSHPDWIRAYQRKSRVR